MMKKKIQISALLLSMGVLMSNCSNEEWANTNEAEVEGNFTLTATVGNKDTRTVVGADYKMLWSTGDAIKVTSDAAERGTMKLTDGAGSNTAKFKGTVASPSTVKYAIYPATATFANKVMTFVFPKTYTATQSNSPMYGTVTNMNENIQFNHLCGMLRLSFKNMPTGAEKTLTLTSLDGNITGKVTADISKDTPSFGAPSDGDAGKEVTVTVAATEKDFFIDVPLPVGTYTNGITVKMTDTSSSDIAATVKKASKIERGNILVMPEIVYTEASGNTPPQFTLPAATKDEAQNLLDGGNTAVSIETLDTKDASDATLSIPAPASAEAAEAPVFIGFKTLTAADNKPAIIKTGEGTYAPKAVTVAIGAVASTDAAPSVTLSMPKSTVTLGTTAATTTYNKVIASTALNTLIIEKGVTVKDLTVKEGNVVINGIVEKLTIEANANTTKVDIEGEGACYEVVDDRTKKAEVLATWDGTSVRESKFAISETTIIGGAAELAFLQLKNTPISTTGGALTNTIKANTTLAVNIDLSNKPWAGMVLADDLTFDGGNNTISNVRVEKYALYEQNIYTNAACVGLFAAAKKNATIKDITVKNFTAAGEAVNAKWSGALVGYSYGAKTYTNCKVDGVTIPSTQRNSYRVGGLIGFIAKLSSDVAVTLTDCSATNVNITAEFSVGGLVGAIQGAANRTFVNCTTSNVKLAITPVSAAFTGAFQDNSNGTKYSGSQSWAGYMSNFIGDLNIGASTLTLINCNATALTAEQTAAFGYDDIIAFSKQIEGKKTADLTKEEIEAIQAEAVASGTHYSLADATTPLIPAQIDGGKIVVGGSTLVSKTDYNLLTKKEVVVE